MSMDLPRRWVLSDNALLALARRPPGSLEEIARLRDLKEPWIRKHGGEILSVIAEASRVPPEQWPKLPEKRAPGPREAALLDGAMAVLRLCALEHKVAPESLGNRRDLERILAGDTQTPMLSGWRAKLAGATILDFFGGKLRLRVDDGELKIV